MTSFNWKCVIRSALAIAALTAAYAPANTNTATAGGPLGGCEPVWDASIGEPGMNASVSALAEYCGDLIAGGNFTTAGGQTANRIARFDGTLWQPFIASGQNGLTGNVSALTVYKGDLIAGGFFAGTGGQTLNNIARWDGSAWQPFTAGGQIGVNGAVSALTVYNGDLIVGGFFTTAGGLTVNRIARWDGTQWHRFIADGQAGVDDQVRSLTEWNGDLIVGGSFATAGAQTVNGIARWDGSAWHPFTSGGQIGVDAPIFYTVWALAVHNGHLFAGGRFTTAGGQTVNHIARWDGSAWHPLAAGGQTGVGSASGTPEVNAVVVYGADVIAGGTFETAGGQTVNRIARWGGSAWYPLVSDSQNGVSHNVFEMTVYADSVIVGGVFTVDNGNHITAWDGCPFRGACCINGAAVQLFADECAAAGGVFHGEEVPSHDVACPPSCPADLNHDGSVGVPDLLQLLSAWGACP